MKNNILISAFSCLPNRGSEPGIGWNWALSAAKTQNVYVLTRTKCKDKIEKNIPEDLKKNLKFIYCDSSKKMRSISIYLEYIFWQLSAYKFAKKLCREIKFDYVMHLTFGNVFLPTFMHHLNLPFIWGPLGGGEKVDYNFYKNFSFKDRVPHILKDILIKTAKINPFVLLASKKAKLIIVRTEDTKKIFLKKYYNKIDLMLETCIELKDYDRILKTKSNEGLNLIYTGRLIAFKNPVVLIDVMNRLKNKKIFLHIIGDGNQKNLMLKKIKEYDLKNVKLYGEISREKCLKLVYNSDVFLFPSFRECGSWSLMEAMLLGKAVICLNRNGMKMVTDDDSAIRIDAKNQEELIDEFEKAILKLYSDKSFLIEIGLNAKKRIENNFNWGVIEKYIERILKN
ncbi:glycosyltransferase [Clostridium perfringens]|nr:glycosyltransferase [Clostridium perfringens]EHA1009145.1 glycosyltransferase [Clostridium perfringens]EHA1021456.1 glycosyltransferase [Clostridium perfringens]MDU6313876.1 glycosyltransferase [Clostridium perfringens]